MDTDWGPSKRVYYSTDYVDEDFPTKLDSKKAKEAREEEVEALKIQRKLLSTIDYDAINDALSEETQPSDTLTDILKQIRQKNKLKNQLESNAREPPKKVKFAEEEEQKSKNPTETKGQQQQNQALRRPINKAMEKNRGLTPYRKKDYRNPRVRHRNKFKKATSKRRHMVHEAQKELTRYSGESTGIKTSTVRSIKFT